MLRTSLSSWLLCLFSLLSCGQTQHHAAKISTTHIATLNHYADKSAFYQEKDPDSAIYYADKGLKLARKLDYRTGEGLMLIRFASINEQYANLKLAANYQQQAIDIFYKLHETRELADARLGMGTLEAKMGNFEKGKQLIEKALAQYTAKKNTDGIISAYTRLAELQVLSKKPELALSYYTKAEQLYKGRPLSKAYFSIINEIGKLHSDMGNHGKAITYYEKGMNSTSGAAYGKTNIAFLNYAGETLFAVGDTQKSLNYHQQGLRKAKALGLHEEEARSLIGIAKVLKNKDADLSVTHLKSALSIAHRIGHKQLSAEIYKSLSEIYKQQSNYQEALNTLQEHHRLLDSLLIINKGRKIAVLQSSYELAESKLRVETLELSNQEKTYQRNLGLLAAAAALLLLIVLAGYFYKTSRLNKRLEASNLIKDKLFSIIGHDLRNPISGITQLLSIMEHDQDMTPEEHHHMISEMRKQGDVTLEILNALLNWGEAQLKGIHIKPAAFNAAAVISKNVSALKKQAADKSILINDNIPEDLSLFADKDHFDFITRNLISNAIKFSYPAGTIAIKANTNAIPGQVVFSVSDHGTGISKSQQEQFLKSNIDISFGTKGEKGTGIGLMLSKEFVKANQGKIWLESEESKGTTFYFSFPSTAQASPPTV